MSSEEPAASHSDPTGAASTPPPPIARTETFRQSRPDIVGPDEPESPYPLRLSGYIQRGFGRGGRDLGCHTANLPDEALEPVTTVLQTGIYYGYARVSSEHDGGSEPVAQLGPTDLTVWPMVMSLGWNPYYKNQKLTAEVHIMHKFPTDFYGHYLDVIILGYIRPELDYTSREALIDDIQTDIRVAQNSLKRSGYQVYASDLARPSKSKPKSTLAEPPSS